MSNLALHQPRKKITHCLMRCALPAILLLFSPIDSARAQDCQVWLKRDNVGSYGQRWNHAMAYDSDRGVVVFFGGEIGAEGEVAYFDDTQEYDGKTWKQINTAVRPPARSGHSMVYDPIRKKIVMTGGIHTAKVGEGTFEFSHKDTWTYAGDGTNGFWELRTPATEAPENYGHNMAWDSTEGVALLHTRLARGRTGRTWSWDGSNWRDLGAGPYTSQFGIGYDSDRGTAVIVAGRQGKSLTNTVWERRSGGEWEIKGPGPSLREELAMAYDERRKRMVMVGGAGESIETGETGYEYIVGTGWVSIPSLPSGQGRAGARMVYDSKRGVMVLTGGAGGGAPNADSGGRYSDTWELWPSLFVSRHPSDFTAIPCGTAQFSVSVLGGVGPFDYQWRRDGVPISDDAHFSGTRTEELTIDGVRHGHAGNYDVVVSDSCSPENLVTSEVATLTLEPDAEWIQRMTPSRPEPRFGHGMAYDSTRRVTVLFGGRTNTAGLIPFNDLWEWDGERWSKRVENSVSRGWRRVGGNWQVSERDQPVRRAHCAMAFDSRRGQVVMFGGTGTDPDGGVHYFRDLWEWDGVRWRFRSSDGPVPRFNCSMAYDELRGRTVLFGGQSVPRAGEVSDGELVWEWDGDRWNSIEPTRNPANENFRSQSRMTYDSFRQVVVFGPTIESHSHWSFWDWDGVEWKIIPVVHFTDPIVTALHGTGNGGFAFDSERRRSVWFGGFQTGVVNRTAYFDGEAWSLLGEGSTLPPPRAYPGMAYDSHRRVTVMFGGSPDNVGASDETWELAAVDMPFIKEQPVSQYSAPGGPAIFSVDVAKPTAVSYQWYHGTTPVPGARSRALMLSDVRPENAGEYSVLVKNACGEVRSRPAVLTLNPGLQIIISGKTVTLVWSPDLKVVLETAEELVGPWTVVPGASSPYIISGIGESKYFRLR